MAKIKVKTPVVELDGDQMTRMIWGFIKDRPGCPGRVHLTPRQSAASAAFSVALGRIAADTLAGSGR
jgi:isocitrate dehydrogenase